MSENENITTPDWEAIKIEYITEKISYAQLAKKYEVSLSTLNKRAWREGWTEQRENYWQRVGRKTLNRLENAEARKLTGIKDSLDEITKLIKSSLKSEDREAYKYLVKVEGQPNSVIDLGQINRDYLREMLELLKEAAGQIAHINGIITAEKMLEYEIEKMRIESEVHHKESDDESSTGGVIVLPTRLSDEG